MKNILHLDFALPTLNQYIVAERSNRYSAAKMKSEATGKCILAAKTQLNINKNGLFDLYITWETKDNRKDSDNIFFGIKFILDAIVNSGKLENDTRKHIRHINNKIFTTGKDRITVEFIEVINI